MGDNELTESSVEGFTNININRSMNSSLSSSTNKSPFCQVIFHDLADVYPTDSDIKCRYSFQEGVKPQPGDRIAVYKVGWASVSEFITYLHPPVPDKESSAYKILFPVESLPKEEDEMYQLCYVTSGNVVAGASIPFTFRKPHESELVAVEDPLDPGLVVFRSRCTQLQDQLDAVRVEKEMFEEHVLTLEKEVTHLKKELSKTSQELAEKVKQLESASAEIENSSSYIRELEIKADNVDILEKQVQQFQEELIKRESEICETREKLIATENFLKLLEATVEGFQQEIMHKTESIKECKVINDSLAAENKKLEDKVKEVTDECLHLKEHTEIQVNEYEADKKVLQEKIKELCEKHNVAVGEKLVAAEEVNELKNSLLAVNKEKMEMVEVISALEKGTEPKVEEALKGTVELAEVKAENSFLRASLMSLDELHGRCQEQRQSALAQLESELLNKHADTVRKLSAELKSAKEANRHQSTSGPPHITKFITSQISEVSRIFTGVHPEDAKKEDITDSKETSAASSKEVIKAKTLMEEKAELSSQLVIVKHESEELKKIIKDLNEEGAGLRSRIDVLEVELGRARGSCRPQEREQQLKELLEVFSDSVCTVDKLNSVQTLLERERALNALLKGNVESLMLETAQHMNRIHALEKEKQSLLEEDTSRRDKTSNSTFEQMQIILDVMELTLKEKEQEVKELKKQQEVLEKEAEDNILLRSTLVLRCNELEQIKKDLRIKEDEVMALNLRMETSAPLMCPFCFIHFPPDSVDALRLHYRETHSQMN